MLSTKQVPAAILILMMISALAVVIIGSRLAREERTVAVEQDRTALTSFTSRLLGEIGDLESLYRDHLFDIRDQIHSGTSNIEIAAICRNIVGVEQATVFRKHQEPVYFDLRETDRTTPLPLPRRRGESSRGAGVIVDVEKLRRDLFGTGYEWIEQPGEAPHFAGRLEDGSILVLRIHRQQVADAMDIWLADWIADAFAPVEAAGILTLLRNPAGDVVASVGKAEADAAPALLLPIPSRFGDWGIVSWQKTETVIRYRQPVLVGSATLAVLLAVAGIFGFTLQRRALRLAEQRVSFANCVSHELRTPLTNILLNIDLVADSELAGKGRAGERLDLIREEAGRLSRLLDNVLTFSKRDKAGNPEEDAPQGIRTVPCAVNAILDEVLAQFAPSLKRKQLEVRRSGSDAAVKVLADPDALSQIVSNLVSNVEKYAADGEKFEIGVSASEEEKTATIAVADFGPGISRSESERIFQPFVRLNDMTTEGVSGTGLGLAIARDLVESMNGKLELIRNEKRKRGARFEVTLPLAADNIVAIAS